MILGIPWWAWLAMIALGMFGTLAFMTVIFALMDAMDEPGDAARQKDADDDDR